MATVSARDLRRRQFQNLAANVLDGHAETLKNHNERLTIITTGVADVTGTVTAFITQSFWGRLKWLLTGR
jgi:hypothetical protein